MEEIGLSFNGFRGWLFFSVFFVMFGLESIKPVRRPDAPRIKRLTFHMIINFLNTLVMRLFFTAPLIAWLLYVQNKGWGLAPRFGLDGMTQVAATVVLFDAFNYWWHRWNHTIPFLWRFHRYHHVDTGVDVTTALRFHIGELVISHLVKAAWILVWGPTLAAFVVFEALITAYAMFHHSNIDFPDSVERIIRWVHMTPRLHAAHHTVSLRTRDANYATIFLIWDRVFGSFREVDTQELKYLGLAEGRESCLNVSAYFKTPFKLGK